MTTTRPPRIPRAQLYFDPADALGAAREAQAHPPGELVRRFERAFADALGAPEAVALPHARVALRELLAALALPPGSEVLMTPVTIPDVASVVVAAGLTPVFVDLGARTCNVDVDDLARKVTPRARAILVTHLCGIPSDMPRVLDLAARRGLEVLEDCSQVPGTRLDGRALGLHGRAGFLSLTPLKPVSTLHGGVVVTRDAALARALRRGVETSPPPLPPATLLGLLARDVAMEAATHPTLYAAATWRAVAALEDLRPEVVAEFQRGNLFNDPARRRRVRRVAALPAWMNARYSDFQAALGLRGLRHLERDNDRRRDLALRLWAELHGAGVPGLPRLPDDPRSCTFWRFPLWVDAPADVAPLRRALRARGVDTSPTNLECLSREEAFAPWASDTPEARRFVDAMVFLPVHPRMRDGEITHVARAVTEVVQDAAHARAPRRRGAASAH